MYKNKISYRPEIDGLRAIAVCAVIFYHGDFKFLDYHLFKGGYIGVDIFFVISGYLISSIILKELIITKSFSFKYFFERRIRRILPVLLVVMLVSLPIAWFFLIPDRLIEFSESILSSIGFSSNFYFHYTGKIYGAINSLYLPFLHTWSLSIEEQFYILYPISLYIIFRYFRKKIILFQILFFVISLILAELLSNNNPSFNFYILPTRVWEFLAGSIVAYIEITKTKKKKIIKFNSILPLVGLFLILYSLFFTSNSLAHPSIYTLCPIIGVCLIIFFASKDEIVTKILSSKLFVSVGLISYSLYLWHYPIFSFARISGFFQVNDLNKLLLLLLTIILSIISYHIIERPFRNKFFKFKRVLLNIFIGIFILTFLNLIIIKFNGFPSRIEHKNGKVQITEFDTRIKYRDIFKKCHENFNYREQNFCKFEKVKNTNTVFLLGDSHAFTLIFDLQEKLSNIGYNLTAMTMPGQVIRFSSKYSNKINLINFQNKRISEIKKVKDSIIIIYGRYSANSSSDYIENEYIDFNLEISEYQNFLIDLKKNNNKIIFIKSNPETPNPLWNNGHGILNPSFYKEFKIQKKKYLNNNLAFERFLKKLNLTSSEILDIQDIFCDDYWCYSIRNNQILISDNNHPSVKGSQLINDKIIKSIKKLNLK